LITGVKRLLVVGEPAVSKFPRGKVLMDTPDFPESYKIEARAGRSYKNGGSTGTEQVKCRRFYGLMFNQ
jgi:hypothetical protein